MAAVNPLTVVLEGNALCSSCWEFESIQAEQFDLGISKNKINAGCILSRPVLLKQVSLQVIKVTEGQLLLLTISCIRLLYKFKFAVKTN